jgi:hypothetical protein
MGVAKELKQQQYKRRQRSRHGEPADWSTQDGQKLIELVATIAASGGAIRFGYTRDGGAFAIGIYGDGEPYTEYLRPGEDIEALLRDVADSIRDAGKPAAKLP